MIEIEKSMLVSTSFTVTNYFIKNYIYCCCYQCISVLGICQYKETLPNIIIFKHNQGLKKYLTIMVYSISHDEYSFQPSGVF